MLLYFILYRPFLLSFARFFTFSKVESKRIANIFFFFSFQIFCARSFFLLFKVLLRFFLLLRLLFVVCCLFQLRWLLFWIQDYGGRIWSKARHRFHFRLAGLKHQHAARIGGIYGPSTIRNRFHFLGCLMLFLGCFWRFLVGQENVTYLFCAWFGLDVAAPARILSRWRLWCCCSAKAINLSQLAANLQNSNTFPGQGKVCGKKCVSEWRV